MNDGAISLATCLYPFAVDARSSTASDPALERVFSARVVDIEQVEGVYVSRDVSDMESFSRLYIVTVNISCANSPK